MNAVAGQTEEKILAIVHERGYILLEELLSCLPESTWNQVFTSVDELSRRGAICLLRRGFDYQLLAPSLSEAGLFERTRDIKGVVSNGSPISKAPVKRAQSIMPSVFSERGLCSDPVFPRRAGRETSSHPGCPRQWYQL